MQSCFRRFRLYKLRLRHCLIVFVVVVCLTNYLLLLQQPDANHLHDNTSLENHEGPREFPFRTTNRAKTWRRQVQKRSLQQEQNENQQNKPQQHRNDEVPRQQQPQQVLPKTKRHVSGFSTRNKKHRRQRQDEQEDEGEEVPQSDQHAIKAPRPQTQRQKAHNLDETFYAAHPKHMTMIQGEKPLSKKKKPLVFLQDPMAVLNYAPSRIPGYINVYGNDTLALYGHVMRELTQRICARKIAQSNILVVSPEAPAVVKLLQSKPTENVGTLRRSIRHAVGGSLLMDAYQQGHAYHGFNTTTTIIDDWWASFSDNNNKQVAQQNKNKPSWILLAMFDHGRQNDHVIASSLTLLKEATVTYIVLGIGAHPNGKTNFYGQQAIQHLMELKYKVQILSISHMPITHAMAALLKPNADLSPKKLPLLFEGMQLMANATGTPVLGYVFCTQGLDLAIPSALEYDPTIRKTIGIKYKSCTASPLKVQFPPPSSSALRAKQRQQQKLQRGYFGGGHRHVAAAEPDQPLWISCQQKAILPSQSAVSFQDMWYSGDTIETSEAVCVRAHCVLEDQTSCTTRILPKKEGRQKDANNNAAMQQERHLKQRLPSTAKETSSKTDEEDATTHAKRPNLLLLMIDPISRARFERSLVKTSRLLELLEFTSFSQYTAVGNNSGPNQAALYSGIPLASRDSIATHGQKGATNRTQWLWETLHDFDYVTFKAEDGCVENSNMIQSIQPKVDHGDALLQMMCFDFQRPNCVGDKAAAQHLIDYGTQFIQAYEGGGRPWAALLHFIDSHEDTQILEGTLDDPIWHFLFSIYEGRQRCGQRKESIPCSVWDNTMIVLLSDHGLHYGNLENPNALKERSQPMLHMHLPKRLSSASEVLETNKKMVATPFDVHETILHALVPEAAEKRHDTTGSTLLQPLPGDRNSCRTTNGVPGFVCDILLHDEKNTNVMMPHPPSVMSFYADIPRVNKQKVTPPCEAKLSKAIFKNGSVKCVCATSLRPWYNCTEHPWSKPNQLTRSETFAMVDCVNDRAFEVQVHRDEKVLRRPEVVNAKSSAPHHQKPNILFLEVDSVSFQYADRHFPQTRELLHSLRLRQSDSDPSGFTCGANETICAAEFNAFSVVGASSIPNQVSAFGGCAVTLGPERCTQLEKDEQNRIICTNSTHLVYTMELVNRHGDGATFCRVDSKKRSPWIFDIAKKAGYVTSFAEEFCHEGSKYVPQGNVFPLDVDILPSKFFCRVAERRAVREGIPVTGPLWQHEYNPEAGKPNCVDSFGGYERSRVALDHIETMWNSYSDVPKFAYLNAIAAHVYSEFKTMADLAEAYDLVLSSFLKDFLARPDMANTIIVVRSDHGLQAGRQVVNYDMQVEAFRPWTEIIVPKSLEGLSLRHLFDNQNKLSTGFDLYKTLTTSMIGNERSLMSEPSPWSHHLWNDIIPETRTCADAHVPAPYCIFESQRTFTSPNLRTCNLAEEEQTIMCPHYSDSFKRNMSLDVGNAFYLHQVETKACPLKDMVRGTHISTTQDNQGGEIDSRANEGLASATSDIHRHYSFQATLVSAILSELGYAIGKAENRPINVCQSGFATMQMPSVLLNASDNVELHVFDNLEGPSQASDAKLLENWHGKSRVTIHKSDPCSTQSHAANREKHDVKCDFLYGLSGPCPADIFDLVQNAPSGILLTSGTTTDDLVSDNVYFGANGKWNELNEKGCISHVRCYLNLVPRQSNAKNTEKFCMAVTTGECSTGRDGCDDDGQGSCDSKVAELTKHIGINRLCSAHSLTQLAPSMAKNASSLLCTLERGNKICRAASVKALNE